MWSIQKNDNGYSIQSKCNGFYLDIGRWNGENLAYMCVDEESATSSHLFDFVQFKECRFKGEGTETSPYQISTADDLNLLAEYINNEETAPYYRNKHYVQTSDIDLKNELFTPIGTKTDGNPLGGGFSGVYDGGKHHIIGLNVNRTGNYNGLFGWCYGGTIKELTVYGSVKGDSLVGGIVGEIGSPLSGNVINCSFNGTITALNANLAGGIVGNIWQAGNIQGCYFNGTVTSEEETAISGGIVGTIFIQNTENSTSVTIQNCYAVSDEKTGGGIVGTYSAVNSTPIVKINNNYYLKTMSTTGINGDLSDNNSGVSDTLLKEEIANQLGLPFVNNESSTFNDGYPVFEWQVEIFDDRIAGDANNDGVIDLKDVVIIRRYVAGGWDVEIDTANADVNADDIVDLKDVVLTRRYIAGGWDVELK